jgi:hypothetical protein
LQAWTAHRCASGWRTCNFCPKICSISFLIRYTYSGVYCVKFNVGTVCNPETKKESQAKEAS